MECIRTVSHHLWSHDQIMTAPNHPLPCSFRFLPLPLDCDVTWTFLLMATEPWQESGSPIPSSAPLAVGSVGGRSSVRRWAEVSGSGPSDGSILRPLLLVVPRHHSRPRCYEGRSPSPLNCPPAPPLLIFHFLSLSPNTTHNHILSFPLVRLPLFLSLLRPSSSSSFVIHTTRSLDRSWSVQIEPYRRS